MKQSERCPWANSDPLYIEYHDKEWGVPVYDDRKLFEFLILEGAQAGLSWLTILKRREGYKRAFANFNPEVVANFTEADKAKLLDNPEIIRNKLKVAAAINNAKHFLKVQQEFGSFSNFQWQFVGDNPIKNSWNDSKDVPATSKEGDVLSKELKKRGFKFVGPTIIYAHMQAVGMVNDHLTSCFRYNKV